MKGIDPKAKQKETQAENLGAFTFETIAREWHASNKRWSDDAIECQLSHSEPNNVRASYIHTSEHFDERRLMIQWWADFLDANKNVKVSSFDVAEK